MVKAIIFDWVGTLYKFGEKGLYPFSEKVLKELYPKYQLAVISKAVPEDLEKRLNQIDPIKNYFKVITVDTEKTPEQFIDCMYKLGVTPKDTLVVDDRTIRGIKIGNALGCPTAWIQTGKYFYELPDKDTGEPTYNINSVEDLLKML